MATAERNEKQLSDSYFPLHLNNNPLCPLTFIKMKEVDQGKIILDGGRSNCFEPCLAVNDLKTL